MRGLFIVLILFAFICFWVLIQRRLMTNRATGFRGRRIRSLKVLMGQHQSTVGETLGQKITLLLVGRIYVIASVFEPDDKKRFLRNMLMPLLISGMVIMANQLYIGLPRQWVAPIVIIMTFFLFYSVLKKRKRKNFNLNFNEALTTITGAISSGRTFLQAMTDYALVSETKLGKEFGTIGRRLNLGDNPEQVFYDSWRRYPYREYYFFIVAIILNIRNGGRLKEVLTKLQKSISTGVAMEKKMLSMTSEMRMAAKITGAIPFVFLLLLKFISPENFDFILHEERGQVILYYLIGSELIGMMIIKFLMRGM
ncbi:Flp pilus assembly protein [Paramixta manurensis]|uniref:Flp pilus assembly protein n=1 Tax=Paramixta manurensis TaxID=2740817 RepID=A0A6M8UCU5_9GAMM|nr:Flp pilus assembly protein [Erwiniaceae bacterium PD-1]